MHTDNNRPNRLAFNRLTNLIRIASFLLLATTLLVPSLGFSLTLKRAEALALESDPVVMGYLATSKAHMDQSVANNTLPDPKFRLGLFNLPIDSLSTTQEPTTQIRLGIQQAFPRGDSLDINQQKAQWLSKSASAQSDNSKRLILRDLRETFLNLFYEIEASNIINETRRHFSKLVKITEAQYAAGRVTQQDVIQADLELSRLEDRSIRIKSKEDEFRASLAQWIGEEAWDTIEYHFPELPDLPDTSDANKLLTTHPSILIETAKIEASRKSTDLAKQDYKPGYNAFFEYRRRNGTDAVGKNREDMLAAMVTMDIPLFTENRQDKKVSASQEKTKAATFKRDDKLRLLKRMLDNDLAMHKRLGERATIYKKELLASAKNNSSASLNAYQSGVTEFNTLMRARITELNVRLDDLRIRIDRKRAQARLLYITGENQ